MGMTASTIEWIGAESTHQIRGLRCVQGGLKSDATGKSSKIEAQKSLNEHGFLAHGCRVTTKG